MRHSAAIRPLHVRVFELSEESRADKCRVPVREPRTNSSVSSGGPLRRLRREHDIDSGQLNFYMLPRIAFALSLTLERPCRDRPTWCSLTKYPKLLLHNVRLAHARLVRRI